VEKSSSNSLPCNISNDRTEPSFTKIEDIVVISSDLSRAEKIATADSSLKASRLMKADQRECKCRKRAVRRESFRWSSVGSQSRGRLHRDNKVTGEKIGEQVSERRRVA
jgi:hypothetical protein